MLFRVHHLRYKHNDKYAEVRRLRSNIFMNYGDTFWFCVKCGSGHFILNSLLKDNYVASYFESKQKLKKKYL